MRRHLLIAAIFLLAGAVVNVAVAWTCALWRYELRSDRLSHEAITPRDLKWLSSRNQEPDEVAYSIIWTCPGVRLWRVDLAEKVDRDGERALVTLAIANHHLPEFRAAASSHAMRKYAGWPLESLYGERWQMPVASLREVGDPEAMADRIRFVMAFPPPEWFSPPSRPVVPIAPVWTGFAVNTLFYAAVLWLLIPGPFAFRRLIRIRRGLCPKCAYPMGESEVCTECGKPLAKRIQATT